MMAQIYQNVGRIVAMLLLLAGSAFFSGVETAYFNLSRRQIKLWSVSDHKLQNLVARLLRKPGQLLNCLLLGNITVNVLFYAVASVLVMRSKQESGFGFAAALAILTFIVLVLFGEILPKSLAYANSGRVAVAAALPVFLVVQILGPIALVFRVLLLEPILRLSLGHARFPKAITLADFRALIDFIRRRGLITEDENKLLAEVVELGFLKVRHVMQPRVDMIACDVTDSAEVARRRMREHRLTKMPVYVKNIDGIVGMIHLRQLLLRPDQSLDKLVQPVHYVPEQKTVESLLEFFRKTQTDMAVVVDEYGGIAGSVRLEDIAEELFGGNDVPGQIEPIEQLGPFTYRLSGELPIHDWAEVFAIDLDETRVSTIGGLVTALLGRIPKTEDVAHLGNLKFTVERVRKRRIETVVLSLEPIPEDR